MKEFDVDLETLFYFIFELYLLVLFMLLLQREHTLKARRFIGRPRSFSW